MLGLLLIIILWTGKAYIDYHTATWGLTALPFVLWLPALIVLVASVWTVWYNLTRTRWHWFVAQVVTLSMIVVPQSGTYNLTLLLVPILIGWAQLERAWRWVWLALWWLLPWLIWKTGNDPNTDLRVVPWLLTIGLLVLVVTRSDTHQPFD